MNRAAVLIRLRVFESDRLQADRTDRRIRGELQLEHLGVLPQQRVIRSLHLRDLEPRALGANTFKERIRRENHVSTAVAEVRFSARRAVHHLEITILDAIRASDKARPTLFLFSWKVRIGHRRPLAWFVL